MLLDKSKGRIHINQINNKDNQTIYGILFYHNRVDFYKDSDYKPVRKLAKLLSIQFEKGEINKHKAQIEIDG